MSAGRNQNYHDPDRGDPDRALPDNDLPLSAIPSIPQQRNALRESRPVATYVIAAAALFAIIVAISFIAAPHLRMPEPRSTMTSTTTDIHDPDIANRVAIEPVAPTPTLPPPSQQRRSPADPPPVDASPGSPATVEVLTSERLVASQPGSPPLADRTGSPQPTPVVQERGLPEAPPAITNEPTPGVAAVVESNARILALRSDLSAKEKALTQAISSLESEKKARRDAERKLEKVTAERSKVSKEAARVRELQDQLQTVTTDRDRAVQQGESRAATLSQQIAAMEAKLAIATDKENRSRQALEARSAQNVQALEGENEAVRKLLAQLEAARAQVEKEKKARQEAERKLQALRATSTTTPEPASNPPASSVASSAPRTPTPKAPPASTQATAPERIKTVAPRYPDDLRQARVGGRVLLRLRIDMLGNVEEVEVIETPHARLSVAAERAAREWKYTPARQDGIRVPAWITEAVDFRQ